MLAPRIVVAQTASPAIAGPFKVPPLPFPTNALEPHVDTLTMEIHHDRHHGAYVASLNTIAKDYPQIAAAAPAEVLAKLNELPEQIRTGVRNNLGGHVNHTMFWQIMSPSGGKAVLKRITATVVARAVSLEMPHSYRMIACEGRQSFGRSPGIGFAVLPS